MKTVLITGGRPVPQAFREMIDRGSTSVEEHRADDVASGAAAALDEADRVVFWSGGDEDAVVQVARRYAKQDPAHRREVVVFVTAGAAAPGASGGLGPDETFVWPRDEDRLKMAFLTGA